VSAGRTMAQGDAAPKPSRIMNGLDTQYVVTGRTRGHGTPPRRKPGYESQDEPDLEIPTPHTGAHRVNGALAAINP
jgi:hypothetical protein